MKIKVKVTSPNGKVFKQVIVIAKKRHAFLFEKDTPFKPKVVKNKKTFKRREKHQRKNDD